MSRARRTRTKMFSAFWMTCTALTWFSSPMYANPEGGVVVGGDAAIAVSDHTTTIEQTTPRAAINWRSFNVASGETVRFLQPDKDSIILNRVIGNDPTSIFGSIDANGKIILINQNGMLFGAGSKVDVGSLIASAADIDTTSFMGGSNTLNFSIPAYSTAQIINRGQITAKEAGLIGLVAPQVENSGIITARLGRIQIGAGDSATLDMYGDGLMSLAITDSPLQQKLNQTGVLNADGGVVHLSAAAGRVIVDSFIGVSGSVSAKSVGTKNGRIVLYAPGRNTVADNQSSLKNKKSGDSTVVVDATIDVSGYGSTEKGGEISILGDHIMLAGGALLDASGDRGGGDIKIGGDYLGTGTTPTALSTYVDPYSLILNNAITNGNGGRTIIWSDGDTVFKGNIFARGGSENGDGGFVETSGHDHLDALGFVDLTSPHGEKGTYLLDPANIAIYGGVTPAFISSDSAINLSTNLRNWYDASDKSTITLAYSTDALGGATASGTIATNTISTSISVASALAPGARVRLTGAGTTTTADILGVNTYTISSIAGTTLTTVEPLTQTYGAGTSLFRGLVSQWTDKSAPANNLTQSTVALRPLFVDTAINGLSSINFNSDSMTSSALGITGLSGLSAFLGVRTISSTNGGGSDGAGSYFWDRQPGGNPLFDIKVVGGKYTLQRRYDDGSGLLGLSSITSVSSAATLLNIARNPGASMTISVNGNQEASVADTNTALTMDALHIGAHSSNTGNLNAYYMDIILYNLGLSGGSRDLVNQYQSAKWNVALDPYGATALSEAVEAMDATNGFSVFSTRYLERLATTANIVLQATNNITLDLKSDTLNLATAGRSLTMTAGNQINTLSAGNITTNGGNMTFNATGGISLAHALGLTSNGGNITFSNNVSLGAAQTFAAGSGNITFTGTVNGAQDLTASANALTFSNPWGGSTPLGNVSLTSASSVTLPSISATSLLARATSASANLTLGAGSVLNASGAGNAITLSAGQNFINNSGPGAVLTPSGRWLVYSTRPADNIRNGLTPNAAAIYNATYAASPPASVAAGNRLLFSDPVAAAPTLTFTADAKTKQYGAANPALTFTRTGSFVDADTALTAFSGSAALTTAINGTSGAGTYLGGIVASAGTLNSYLGYAFSFVNGNFIVTTAPLTITAGNSSKNYGVLKNFTGSEFATSGLLNSDSVTSVTLSSAGAAVTANVAGSPYAITPGAAIGSGLTNYTITYTDGQLTVSPVGLTIAATNSSKNYGSLKTFTGSEFTATGLLNSDSVSSVSLSSAGAPVTANVSGSPYAITPSAAIGSGLNNYIITYNDGQLTVLPIGLTITANNASKNYGTFKSFTGSEFTTSGLLNSDSVSSVTLNSSGAAATANVTGSPYAITPSAALGSGLGNYTITYNDGQLSVAPVGLVITADDKSRLYGQPNPVFTASYTGLVAGDTDLDITGLSLTTNATLLSAPGFYTINAAGAVSPNYTITLINGLLQIGGSIPVPGFNAVSQNIPEVLDRLIQAINNPITNTAEFKSGVTPIEFDENLKNFLSCADFRQKHKLTISCW